MSMNEPEPMPSGNGIEVWPHVVRGWEEAVDIVAAIEGRGPTAEAMRQVIADMKERDAMGRAKYGTPLRTNNGRDALVDAYQEALDLRVYLEQVLVEGRASVRLLMSIVVVNQVLVDIKTECLEAEVPRG